MSWCLFIFCAWFVEQSHFRNICTFNLFNWKKFLNIYVCTCVLYMWAWFSIKTVSKRFVMIPISSTVKPVLRDHYHDRPPVLTGHTFEAERRTFQYNWTCHQRPPVLKDHIFVANGVVFQDRFYCTQLLQYVSIIWAWTLCAVKQWNLPWKIASEKCGLSKQVDSGKGFSCVEM